MVDRAPRILLVDDEHAIQTLLSYPLRKDGYEVVQATDGSAALARFAEGSYDLVVLDLMMPKLDGLEVCRRIRARSTVPIIMLTARAEEIDKGLAPADGPLEVLDLSIDFAKRAVRVRDESVQTTYVEFEILGALATHPGRVFTRENLLTRIWGDSAYRDPRTIDVHIRHLREKLELDAKQPEYLFTVRGVGYRFRDER